MKFTKLALGALLLGVTTSGALAQEEIILTGSTAFREFTNNAILAILDNEQYAYTGASFIGSTQAIFKGDLNGTPVVIKTSYSGAHVGVAVVALGNTVPCLPTSTTVSPGGISGLSAGSVQQVADIAMSDEFQATTNFPTPELSGEPVGIIPFKWIASHDAPANLTNITSLQAQALWKTGYMPLAILTGDDADFSTLVNSTYGDSFFGDAVPVMAYPIGRDPGSGTRLITFAESGIGINSVITQFNPSTSNTNDPVLNQVLAPAGSTGSGTSTISWGLGNGGYSSGGTLAAIMRRTTMPGLGGVYISYMGISDANTALAVSGTGAGPAKELTWNGVAYSDENIINGSYTFWSYQHLLYRPSLAGIKLAVATALTTQIQNNGPSPLLSEMQVQRTEDGGPVSSLNY